MNASTAASAPTVSVYASGPFWERLWRASGIQFVGLFVLAYFIYGYQPGIGASADELTTFYSGHRTRIIIAVVFSGLNILNLMWFTAALRTTLAEFGQDGWGAAATAASAAVGGVFLLLITVGAAGAYSIAASGNSSLLSTLNDFMWGCVVTSSFPRAMLTMAAAFGLWRASLISNTLFAAGVAAVVLVLLGGTTWIDGGFWAPDGAYSRFISPAICLMWLGVVSQVVMARNPARTGW